MEIVEFPVPQPEPGVRTVAVDVASVCGTDVHGRRGQYAGVLPIELPLVLGHEVVGRIAAIGDGADVSTSLAGTS